MLMLISHLLHLVSCVSVERIDCLPEYYLLFDSCQRCESLTAGLTVFPFLWHLLLLLLPHSIPVKSEQCAHLLRSGCSLSHSLIHEKERQASVATVAPVLLPVFFFGGSHIGCILGPNVYLLPVKGSNIACVFSFAVFTHN